MLVIKTTLLLWWLSTKGVSQNLHRSSSNVFDLNSHQTFVKQMLYKTSSCYQAALPPPILDQSKKLFWTASITFHQECGMRYHLWCINRLLGPAQVPFFCLFLKPWARPKAIMWVWSLLTRRWNVWYRTMCQTPQTWRGILKWFGVPCARISKS